jgi:carboxyl-terminal processing protease
MIDRYNGQEDFAMNEREISLMDESGVRASDGKEVADAIYPKEPVKKKKRKRKRSCLGGVALFLLALIVGILIGRMSSPAVMLGGTSTDFDTDGTMKKIGLIEQYIDRFYLEDVDEDKVEDGIYHGLVSGLGDPFSEYYTEDEYRDMMEEDQGEYRGIGIVVYKDSSTGYVVIESVMKDQPAYNAGIENGDILISVDGKDTTNMTLSETVGLIKRGEADTTKLVILRDTKTFEKEVDKTNIVLESVSHEMKEDDIGYISISQFIDNTDEQFIEAVGDLQSKGMKGLVIDLRDNGGGLVSSCVNMLSRLIPEDKLLVYMEDKNGDREEYKSDSPEVLDTPIVILVNGNTASASEIFTGCLKDYDLAEVVGSKTYGKGIVQSVMPLGDGSALKLTVSEYFTPDGREIHKKGIEPDVKLEYTNEEWADVRKEKKKDTQLEKAISMLKEKK